MNRTRIASPWTLALAAVLALAACGSDTDESTSVPTTVASPATTAAAAAATTAAPAATSAAENPTRVEVVSSTTAAAASATTAAAPSAEFTEGPPTAAGPASKDGVLAQQPSLRAGSVDDNGDLDRFRAYQSKIAGFGVKLRPFDTTGRVVVKVLDVNGRPAGGERVDITDSEGAVATLHTTADGTARFFPRSYRPSQGPWVVQAGETKTVAVENDTLTITLPDPAAATNQLDVMFVLDATGSMGDEIARLKTSIDSVASRISSLPSQPDLRIAMTVFRDEGDEFVTRSTDFTGDVGAFRSSLGAVQASGGGDTPEAVDEALDAALDGPSWRPTGSATQLVFLVGDAGPHADRAVRRGSNESATVAAGRGIKIFPVASSNSDDLAEASFRQIAAATGARFVFLSYGAGGAGGAATGGNTDISSDDYEELALDDLIVRLVAEELASRNG